MAVIEFQTQVNAPPEKVFAYISDLEKHVDWTHCSEITKVSEGAVGSGTMYDSTGKNMGMTTTEKVEVTEYQPNQRFAWRGACDHHRQALRPARDAQGSARGPGQNQGEGRDELTSATIRERSPLTAP